MWGERMICNREDGFSNRIVNKLSKGQETLYVLRFLQRVIPKDRDRALVRHYIRGGITGVALARIFDLSPARIRQIKFKCFWQLRKACSHDPLMKGVLV
jgi:DNA-directed RNA polymerase sigma subunit (sigma70/sigma32)